MSLIITSNVNLQDRVEESQIHKPWSYHNRLHDTMKVPKDSEIAVQSVKINKNGLQSINRANSTFATYWGRPMSGGNLPAGRGIYDTPYHPCITSVVEDDGVQDITTDEVATSTTNSLLSSMYCPHMLTGVSSATAIPEGDVACEVKSGANGDFQGYDFDIQFNTAKQNHLVSQTDLDAGKVEGVGQKDFDGSGGMGVSWEYFIGQNDLFMSMNTNERPNVGGAQIVLKDYPVALNSTGWSDASVMAYIDFANGADGEWAVGLVRDTIAQLDPIDNQFLGYAPEESDIWWSDADTSDGAEGWGRTHQFYDYVICRRGQYLQIEIRGIEEISII